MEAMPASSRLAVVQARSRSSCSPAPCYRRSGLGERRADLDFAKGPPRASSSHSAVVPPAETPRDFSVCRAEWIRLSARFNASFGDGRSALYRLMTLGMVVPLK
jgi:hypothetical protein